MTNNIGTRLSLDAAIKIVLFIAAFVAQAVVLYISFDHRIVIIEQQHLGLTAEVRNEVSKLRAEADARKDIYTAWHGQTLLNEAEHEEEDQRREALLRTVTINQGIVLHRLEQLEKQRR